MAYRDDGDAREMLNESLEQENKLLVKEAEELRAKVKRLESEKTRLQMIAGELAMEKPPVARPPTPEQAQLESTKMLREIEHHVHEVRATFRHTLILIIVTFGLYQMLVQALSH